MAFELLDDRGSPFGRDDLKGRSLTILSTYRGRW